MSAEDTQVMVNAIIHSTMQLEDERQRHKQTLAQLQKKTVALDELARETVRLNGEIDRWTKQAADLAERTAILQRNDVRVAAPKVRSLCEAAEALSRATETGRGSRLAALSANTQKAIKVVFDHFNFAPF